jgi:ubiquinone/menaquinone biosynthesis C-methylase UbiE
MGIVSQLFLRMFGHPRGALGRLGGHIMARMNDDIAVWAIGLLDVRPGETVLEIGFGPGMAIKSLVTGVLAVKIYGIDDSPEMVAQAAARNDGAIKSGRVDLRHGSVEDLPFKDSTFDKVIAINSMQLWPNIPDNLHEIRRVMKAGGKIALAFTPYSGQAKDTPLALLRAAGFSDARMLDGNIGFCALAAKP